MLSLAAELLVESTVVRDNFWFQQFVSDGIKYILTSHIINQHYSIDDGALPTYHYEL